MIGEGSSNGIDAQAVSQRVEATDSADLRTSFGFAANSFVVGFIGRVTADKGVDTLLQAFAHPKLHPDARLLLVGPLEDPLLESAIHMFGERVVWLRWVDDVWGVLPSLDVLALPSRREGFPTVVLEAAAAGVPAIVSRATGARDSVVDNVTGLIVDGGDELALVAAVNALAADPETRHAMGEAAQARVRSAFGQERVWNGLRTIYTGGIDRGNVRRI